MKRALIFLTGFAALSMAVSAFETQKELSLPAQGLKRLEITAGAGSLEVVGREGLTAVEVTARVVAPGVREKDLEDYLQDEVVLELKKAGEAAVLVSRVRGSRSIIRFRDDARIDLTVRMPKSLALDIEDGSGDMVVEGTGAPVRIDDGSGDIRVLDVGGPLNIEDGSGEIEVKGVRGDLTIEDGSGGVEVSDVSGDVTIEDGSGDLRVRRVGGGVTVDDGSGDIDIEGVEKDVRLIDTGSGEVSISGEKGRVIRSS